MHARFRLGSPASAPPRRPVLTALVAFAVTLGSVIAGAAPASFAEATDTPEVTWGVRPASNDFGEARENYVYRVDPGETLSDAIVVSNYDTAPVVLDVYGADGFTTSSGQFDVATREVRPRDLGAWVVPAADRVTVQPGESLEVPFTITVPRNATPGDHAGGILTSLTNPEVEQGITVDRRLGIRIHLRVGGDLAPSLAIDGLAVGYSGTLNPFGTGAATVSFTVRNAGNARLSAGQAVTLAGPFGLFRLDAAGVEPVPELLPGETWPVSMEVPGVIPAFLLTADVVLTPVAPAVDEAPQIVSVQASAATAAVPWTLLVLVLLVVGGVVLWVVLARRRRAGRKALEDARVQEAVDRALRERDAQTLTAAYVPADAAAEQAGDDETAKSPST